MNKSCRITVRLRDELMERVRGAAKEAGIDASTIVRHALEACLAGTAPGANGSVKRPLPPPDEIDPFVQKYRSWVDGDLRKERDRLFRALLGAAFICKLYYPRTANMTEGYIELRHLAKFFGIKEGG